ncbi:MerR family transcriptional regulator [Fructilactobacillus myrtifloralis]|uniref:MerR family transcriptional regulator n=1 Tax=Fructilactobacillus myrtifloralis TaxID=2940301 RepID=A0ABY5BN18_9LACO|nr:MerR family transcriptional regulator [Fructilactobacillus myrtifloralis]USS84502.1 MerR family transcriptional regulator [Fructilactobacillus myrtifloralis]
MAKLAHTTRRTLIFYDEKGIFKPHHRDQNGYRYYAYNQLYDLTFILGLRKLGVSLSDIQAIRNTDQQALAADKLIGIQTQINRKITELTEIQTIINNRLQQTKRPPIPLYQPVLRNDPAMAFWCSRQSVNCTEEEVAQLFSEFYQQFPQLAALDTNQSGFLTTLGVNNPAGYATASFRIIREVNHQPNELLIPVINKPAGLFVGIHVENTLAGIHRGLVALKAFCQRKKISTEDYLWQINDDNQFVSNGASRCGWLEFRVVNH